MITDLLIIHATSVQTNTCGPAINILKIPITEPSVPGLIYRESIANGSAQTLAQPIPDSAIPSATTTGEVLKIPITKYARAIEINEISDELLDLMASQPKIAKHLHIPLQSADDVVLKHMNRPYCFDAYAERIKQIRNKIPDISISTDIITGFPQESNEQFQLGLSRIQSLGFSFLHVFPFSKRDGTKAAKMQGHVDHLTKKNRCTQLMELSDHLYETYQATFLQKDVSVIWEKQEGDWMVGHTSEYLCVYAPYDANKLHQMECLRITSFENHRLLCQQEVNG